MHQIRGLRGRRGRWELQYRKPSDGGRAVVFADTRNIRISRSDRNCVILPHFLLARTLIDFAYKGQGSLDKSTEPAQSAILTHRTREASTGPTYVRSRSPPCEASRRAAATSPSLGGQKLSPQIEFGGGETFA